MLTKHSINNIASGVKNPQSNAICERIHQTVANVLRIYMQTTTIETYENAKQVMNNALATAMHATRCAVNHTMKNSPGEIVFSRDMFVDVPVIANIIAIRQRRQLFIDKNLMRHNQKRYDYKCRIGEQ